MVESYNYCYECKYNKCRYWWFAPHKNLTDIEECPECGATERIQRMPEKDFNKSETKVQPSEDEDCDEYMCAYISA